MLRFQTRKANCDEHRELQIFSLADTLQITECNIWFIEGLNSKA